MKKTYVLFVLSMLCASSVALAYGPYPGHLELNAANSDIYSALNSLAQARNHYNRDPFGGHRQQAMNILENQALEQIQAAVNYANKYPSDGACTTYPSSVNPNPFPRHPELSMAEVRLEFAAVALQNACNGANAFGDFRDKALASVQQAENQIAAAVDWANTHGGWRRF
jgi:hypothetical protein